MTSPHLQLLWGVPILHWSEKVVHEGNSGELVTWPAKAHQCTQEAETSLDGLITRCTIGGRQVSRGSLRRSVAGKCGPCCKGALKETKPSLQTSNSPRY